MRPCGTLETLCRRWCEVPGVACATDDWYTGAACATAAVWYPGAPCAIGDWYTGADGATAGAQYTGASCATGDWYTGAAWG